VGFLLTRSCLKKLLDSFLNDYYWGIKKFRNGAELNVKALHSHALRFINFFGLLIEEKDPVVFQLMINDNNHTHNRCHVGSVNIGVSVIQYTIPYSNFNKILDKLCDKNMRPSMRHFILFKNGITPRWSKYGFD